MSQGKRSLPRREFVKNSAASLVGASMAPSLLAAGKQAANIQELDLWEPDLAGQFDYPLPRYPKNLPSITSVNQLLPMARQLASEPPRAGLSHLPGYGIASGEKALLIAPSNYDQLVVDAIATALKERGVRVDIAIMDASAGRGGGMRRDGETGDGAAEGAGTLNSLKNPRPRTRGRAWFIDHARLMNYNLVIEGSGGPLVYTTEGVTDFSHHECSALRWPSSCQRSRALPLGCLSSGGRIDPYEQWSPAQPRFTTLRPHLPPGWSHLELCAFPLDGGHTLEGRHRLAEHLLPFGGLAQRDDLTCNLLPLRDNLV